MTLISTRCNPYGFGTDAGPRHLMGGVFGPEYAGGDLVLADGVHGIGICPRPADGWFIMQCAAGHTGPRMPLCYPHVQMIQKRMAQTCTACVMPAESRALWEQQRTLEREAAKAYRAGDQDAVRKYQGRIAEVGREQVLLTQRGLTPRRPLKLVEVS